MTNTPFPSPAHKLLVMLEEDEIERLPLDLVVERLRENGVDPAMPDHFRELVGDKRRPAEYPLSEIERLPLDAVVERLRENGVDPAMPDHLRELVGDKRKPAKYLLSLLDKVDKVEKVEAEQQ